MRRVRCAILGKCFFRFSPIKFTLLFVVFVALIAGKVSLSQGQVLGDVVNGVSFQCKGTARTNIAGETMSPDVDSIVTNSSGARMIMRYHFTVTSDQDRTFDAGPGGKQLSPGAVERHQYNPFDKVSPQDEFPAQCQFTKVQVCPATIPANWPKTPGAAYYDPFHDGPALGCREPVDLQAVKLASKKVGCTALVDGSSYGTNWWTQYGMFVRPFYTHTAASKEEAISKVTSQTMAQGFLVRNDNLDQNPKQVQCEAPHGAVIALRKPDPRTSQPMPEGVFDTATMIVGPSKNDAIQKGLQSCNGHTTSPGNEYAKAGITACEVLDSW
jgi:hypothetical protein